MRNVRRRRASFSRRILLGMKRLPNRPEKPLGTRSSMRLRATQHLHESANSVSLISSTCLWYSYLRRLLSMSARMAGASTPSRTSGMEGLTNGLHGDLGSSLHLGRPRDDAG